MFIYSVHAQQVKTQSEKLYTRRLYAEVRESQVLIKRVYVLRPRSRSLIVHKSTLHVYCCQDIPRLHKQQMS